VKPVLILGAGINGAAVARDLAINGIPVCIVDTGDVARGATSRSSRLIHGGLRYLEYRDTDLVRESLRERERLLTLAPHFVKPLRLTIPVDRQTGGLWAGFLRFSGLAGTSIGQTLLKIGRGPRGLLAIRAGLALYDRLAHSDVLPGHEIRVCHDASSSPPPDADKRGSGPRLSPRRFRWQCSYSDAQIEFPERFVLALLEDGRRAAEQTGTRFDVLPYHQATASETESMVRIEPLNETSWNDEPAAPHTITPSAIINATGAWGDRTLEALGLRERQLFAGTKGSHLFTNHPSLITALNGNGIYAEADDGRLIFILPCAAGVLIGTTDDPYAGDPGDAVSTPADVDYLLEMVNDVFPEVHLTVDQINMHHAGVRPLPNSEGRSTSAIPRGHSIEETVLNGVPVLTLVGGKLTTCRSLAEQVCSIVCTNLSRQRTHETADRLIPGAENIPSAMPLEQHHRLLAAKHGLSIAQVQALWKLVGNRFDEIFPHGRADDHQSITGTLVPQSFVRWSIDREWCTKLDDLVERRLMLIFESRLRRDTLRELGESLVNAGRLDESQLESEVDRLCDHLQKFYGKTIDPD
jgi:glycerol-3-phosphate dehydrogenase